ncbi:hypothetical protein REPUB_Repub13aG0045300 [Reevesia pubescens]
MKKERITNRTKVYEFLRGLGIIPDELDGLELSVTVEVMRERIDFLHTLGLTVEDANNYPLVLGCSVKKNMIPVLDYLGKLGVRKSTLTEFLRRYPQVLYASVVVDLAPVVKYLYPEILGIRVGRVIKPFVEYLQGSGIPRLAIARLIEKQPHILGFGLEERVKPNVESLLEFNVRKASLPSIIAQYSEIVGIDFKPKLLGQRSLLQSIIDLEPEDFGLWIFLATSEEHGCTMSPGSCFKSGHHET